MSLAAPRYCLDRRQQPGRRHYNPRMPMPPSDPRRPAPQAAARATEQRLVGLHACRAAFARRPQDLRKLWLIATRQRELRDMLAWCVRQRIGYRIVEP